MNLPSSDVNDLLVIVSVASVSYYVGSTFPLAVAILVAMFYRQVSILPNDTQAR